MPAAVAHDACCAEYCMQGQYCRAVASSWPCCCCCEQTRLLSTAPALQRGKPPPLRQLALALLVRDAAAPDSAASVLMLSWLTLPTPHPLAAAHPA